ncbi:MAG: cell division protein FtsX [Erythrobacter sp.]
MAGIPVGGEDDGAAGGAAPERPERIVPRRAGALLPQPRMAGPMPWVIGILIALMLIAAAGGLALRNLAAASRADLAAAVSVQVIEPDATLRTARAREVAALLAEAPLVQSVRIVPEAELAALLEPWLGAGAAAQDVPIPALIDVELTRRASPTEIAQITAVLDGAGGAGGAASRGLRVDAQGEWLRPVYDALAALQYLALALIGLVALATMAAVWLAARNAFATHRETVEIVHLLGGTASQITGIFTRAVLREAVFGAVLGTVLGGAAAGLLGLQFAALGSGLVAGGSFGLADWLVLAAVPLAGVLLALATARITIALALKAML